MARKQRPQVRATVNTVRGVGPGQVPAGTLGYVQGKHGDHTLVQWVGLPKAYKGDWGTSSHPTADLEATGQVG